MTRSPMTCRPSCAHLLVKPTDHFRGPDKAMVGCVCVCVCVCVRVRTITVKRNDPRARHLARCCIVTLSVSSSKVKGHRSNLGLGTD